MVELVGSEYWRLSTLRKGWKMQTMTETQLLDWCVEVLASDWHEIRVRETNEHAVIYFRPQAYDVNPHKIKQVGDEEACLGHCISVKTDLAKSGRVDVLFNPLMNGARDRMIAIDAIKEAIMDKAAPIIDVVRNDPGDEDDE